MPDPFRTGACMQPSTTALDEPAHLSPSPSYRYEIEEARTPAKLLTSSQIGLAVGNTSAFQSTWTPSLTVTAIAPRRITALTSPPIAFQGKALIQLFVRQRLVDHRARNSGVNGYDVSVKV